MSILKRLKAPMPFFWKKVQRICIAIGATSIAGFAIPVEQVPHWMDNVLQIGTTIGLVGFFLSQLTIQDKSDLNDKP